MTIEHVVRLWLELLRWSPQGRLRGPLRAVAAAHLFPHLGGVPVAALRRRDIRRFFAELEAAGTRPGDIVHTRAILVEAFDLAVLYGWARRNVALEVRLG